MINNIEESNTKTLINSHVLQINKKSQNDEIVKDKEILENSILNTIVNDNNAHQFYDFPKYYDKAFQRDVISDIIFFHNCFQQYSDLEVKRVLEPACGSGMFLEILPQFGYYALGYDLSPEMVNYSKERLKKCGLTNNKADVVIGNMKNIKFNEQFDAAFICINSLGYLRSDEDISSHFKLMGKTLKEGGIYIVEISCKCDDIRNEKKLDDTWYIEEDFLKLELTWAINWYDIEHRIRHVDFRMIINDSGNKTVVEEAHELRLWLLDEFIQFASLGGFEIKGVYNQNYEKIAENIPITGELGALFFILKKIG
ncbi:MAG: class I SAM-dependent methyltransferase [Candidatus Hermodarchaeota archaeon]